MRALLQRVRQASVNVNESQISRINAGWLVFLGVAKTDTVSDLDYLVKKICELRAFPDTSGKCNLSLMETGGEVLLVSQFTLYADCRKGRRPSFGEAADPVVAQELYHQAVAKLEEKGVTVSTGKFQESMVVSLENCGPMTLMVDSAHLNRRV